MRSRSFFQTLVYYQDLKTPKNFNGELLEECRKIKEFDRKGRAWSKKNYLGGYTSYGSMARLHQFSSSFADLERRIRPHVNSYIRELGYDLRGHELWMTDCWLNMMPAQVAHGLHLHPNSFISGTYYVSTPKDSAGIKFEDPRLPSFMNCPPRKDPTSTFVTFPAKAGKVVLFESWLRHEVPASANTEERVSVSFNYNWG
jgi:uncharacterized protein (TIGR02466 family)